MKDIWPNNTKIEVLGVTGPYSSGKTLFVLTIDPANTLYFDFEKSGGNYEQLGMTRINMPNKLLEDFPGGYTPKDAFTTWLKMIKSVNPGDYSVIALDPISDIEDGLVEWVKSRYKDFGFKTPDAFQSTGGIFWARVLAEWKKVLADLAARCQTFAFTSHLKKVWKYGKPTNNEVPKGKSTLMELSSLYISLDREPVDKDTPPPLIPGGTVLKTRISSITNDENGMKIVPSLPPRLPEATPQKIRDYILNPPDYDNLSVQELEKSKELSEDERLELQREISENNKAAADSQATAAALKEKADNARAKALSMMRPSPDKSDEVRKVMKESRPQQTEVLNEEECRSLLNNAHKAGLADRVLAGVWKTLKSRGVDVESFTKETAVEFTMLLTKEEFDKFEKHLSNSVS